MLLPSWFYKLEIASGAILVVGGLGFIGMDLYFSGTTNLEVALLSGGVVTLLGGISLVDGISTQCRNNSELQVTLNGDIENSDKVNETTNILAVQPTQPGAAVHYGTSSYDPALLAARRQIQDDGASVAPTNSADTVGRRAFQ